MSRLVRTSVGVLIVLLAACGQPGGVQMASPLLPQATRTPTTESHPAPTATWLPSPHQTPVSSPRATPDPSPTPATTPRAPVQTPPALTLPTSAPEMQAVVDAARAYLAGRLSIPVGQIELVNVESVDWPDTSLGCPQPGMMYAQVITPGYRVVLQAKDRQYELHTNKSGKHVVLCPGPTPGARIDLKREQSREDIVALARQHLAEYLGVPIEKVQVVSVEDTEWEGDTMGCSRPPGHQPARAYPGPLPGYRIVLAVDGVQYEYHSGNLWLVLCGVNRG